MRKVLMSFCTSWNFSPQSFVYPIISFVCLISMYKLKGNYTVGTKGLCSTDSLINFIWFLQGNFCSKCSKRNLPLFTGFPLYLMHRNQGCLHRIHRDPVDFKFGIDLAQKMNKYAESTLKSASFIKAFVGNIMIGAKILKIFM